MRDRSRKTSVTRELPDGGAVKPRQHSPVLSLFRIEALDVRTVLLFTMSKADNNCRRKSENRVQTPGNAPDFLVLDSGF